MNKSSSSQNFRRVLAQVEPSQFIGRTGELKRIIEHASPENIGKGLLLKMEPAAGVSELMRQAYDQIFNQQTAVVPIYFAFTRNETTAVSAAIEFLNTFLQQYIAFRKNDPSIAHSPLSLPELLDRADAEDQKWIEQLDKAYRQLRFSNDDKALVRFCLGAPQRIPAKRGRPLIMLDGAQLAEYMNGAVILGTEVLRVFGSSGFTFVLAGLRRQILHAAHDAECNFDRLHFLDLNRLTTDEAALLVERVAQRQQVKISDVARDLLVQQFESSPFFINAFLQAARERGQEIHSHLDCERLYVHELFGGHLHRHFADLLEEISPRLETRNLLITLLWNAVNGKDRLSSFEDWRKRLDISAGELEDMLHRLHIYEFVSHDGTVIEAGLGPQAWKDYLKIRYQLDVENKPRALVVATALTDVLKRAPDTMTRHYKQSDQVSPRKLVSSFNWQRVPVVLFDYADFSRKYKGEEPESVASGLDTEQLLKLPQTVHLASGAAFKSELRAICEDERCLVAHTFEEGSRYSDAQEVVWLVAYLDEKVAVEVDVDLARAWCERFKTLAREFDFTRYQIWLISNSGFTGDALQVLAEHKAFGSNEQQFKLLSARIGDSPNNAIVPNSEPNEFRLEMPTGEDNETIAAETAGEIARRLPFPTQAINNIKHAIIEACINVFEHSFSPDRKISHRFRVESDRLVVTISSRGVVPTNLNGASSRSETNEAAEARRGKGLILIRSLMDEVEFERVDDGTSLRMTKYLRDTAS